MEITVTRQDGNSVMTLAGDLTIYHAMDVRTALLDALAMSDTLEVNLAEVAEMDSAGLQLLCLAKREAALHGKTLRLLEHSDATREVLETVGLIRFFGDPMLIPAERSAGAGGRTGWAEASTA